MNSEPISTLEELKALPAFPTIGSVLNVYVSAIGSKEFPKGSEGLRKRLQLLSHESDQVDLDSYVDLLNATLESYKLVTKDIPFHWIDEAQLYHYFRAYQQLILHLPVIGMTEQFIHNLTAYYFLFCSIHRYAWMVKTFEYQAKLHVAHFLIGAYDNLQQAFMSLIQNVKRLLGEPLMSDWKFISKLYPELMSDEEQGKIQDKAQISELVGQLQSWGTRATSPKYHTFKEKIVDRLATIEPKIAQILEVDFVSWKWLATIMQHSNLEFRDLYRWFSQKFNRLITKAEPEAFSVPNDFVVKSEELSSFIMDVCKDFGDFVKAQVHYNPSIEPKTPRNLLLPKVEAPSIQKSMEFLHALAYRSGCDFVSYSEELFQLCLNHNLPQIRDVFKKRFIHGLLPSSFATSKAWINRQIQYSSKPSQEKYKDISTNFLKDDQLKWVYAANAKNINIPKKWGRYFRSRLIVAVYTKNSTLVQKCLDLGADALWVSEPSSKQPGDNLTALLACLQSLTDSNTKEDFFRSKKIAYLILDHLTTYPKELVKEYCSLSLGLTKKTPLSLAINSGQIDILEKLLTLHPRLDLPFGGDDFFPIYSGVNWYFFFKAWSKDNPDALASLLNNGSINNLRSILPDQVAKQFLGNLSKNPELISKLSTVLKKQICLVQTNETNLREIIRLLARSGAETNRMSPNGRYPLDLAIEISQTFNDHTIIKVVHEIGEYKRAVL